VGGAAARARRARPPSLDPSHPSPDLIHAMGGTVVAVSDRHGAVHNAAGLDVPALRRHVRARPPFGGSLRSFPGGSPLPLSELLPLECDVFIPAAIGGVINERTARSVKAGVVVEAANAATTPAGDAVLRERGVAVVPDIYASGGGVTVSFFEWVQVRPRRARAGPALALASPSTLDPSPPPPEHPKLSVGRGRGGRPPRGRDGGRVPPRARRRHGARHPAAHRRLCRRPAIGHAGDHEPRV